VRVEGAAGDRLGQPGVLLLEAFLDLFEDALLVLG
jgi:hypothetical protein